MTETIQAPESINMTPPSTLMPSSTQSVPPHKETPVKNVILIGVISCLVLLAGYQQSQIMRLTGDLTALSGDVRSSETRSRLDAIDTKVQEMGARLSYLDSKITAADQKGQVALDKIKAQEEKDWFGNFLKSLGWK